MTNLYESNRLKFRRFLESDADNLFALDSDPEVMRHLGGPISDPEKNREALKRIIAKYELWGKYGAWVAELKSTGEFVGWFSLKPLPGFNDIEIGYRLMRRHWGQGLATEGASRMARVGFEEFKLEKIVAVTAPANFPSQKVLKKIGMKYLGERDSQEIADQPKTKISWFELTKAVP